MIDGYCHPDFKELENHFRSLMDSGYETGASFAVEKDGEMIVDLWGGFKDKVSHQRKFLESISFTIPLGPRRPGFSE